MNSSDISEIEALAAAAWPAEEQTMLGPWRLRATQSVTSRANSVFTAGAPGDATPADVERLIAEAEAFYARRRLSALFQISPGTIPADLDAILARRGYGVIGPSEVWTADVREVIARAAPGAGDDVVLAARPDAAWLDCAYDEPARMRRVHEGIVGRIERPAQFASIRAQGMVLACAFCVSGEGRGGIFSMVTRPDQRGRGLGMRILHHLARWAAARGDTTLYLQVSNDNEPARGLYRRLGFTPAYPYHFRLKPLRELRAASAV